MSSTLQLTPEQKKAVAEIARKSYEYGWTESRRWPNHPRPPLLTFTWDDSLPGGFSIQETPR